MLWNSFSSFHAEQELTLSRLKNSESFPLALLHNCIKRFELFRSQSDQFYWKIGSTVRKVKRQLRVTVFKL